jgi:hypothetical protein
MKEIKKMKEILRTTMISSVNVLILSTNKRYLDESLNHLKKEFIINKRKHEKI